MKRKRRDKEIKKYFKKTIERSLWAIKCSGKKQFEAPYSLLYESPTSFYPRHICRVVYSFRLTVRMFVRSYVRHVRGIYDKVFHRVAGKFLKWSLSHKPLIRKHSYLDHTYPWRSAFIPWLLTPGSMPQDGAKGQNLGHLLKVFFSVMETTCADNWSNMAQCCDI